MEMHKNYRIIFKSVTRYILVLLFAPYAWIEFKIRKKTRTDLFLKAVWFAVWFLYSEIKKSHSPSLLKYDPSRGAKSDRPNKINILLLPFFLHRGQCDLFGFLHGILN